MSRKKLFSSQWRCLGLAILVLCATACTKSVDSPNPPAPAAGLTGFSFLQASNPIPVNSTGTIIDNVVTIFLPPGTDAGSLKASFTLANGASASVGGAPQQSGITANDFTKPVSYTITMADGSQQSFSVSLITDINAIDEQVTAFMQKYNVPGLSISIVKDDRLVYQKAFGYSVVETNTPATTSTLFRMASDSKQFTSVAIMRLLDQGQLSLTDKVFGPGAILGTTYGTQPYGPGVTDITVSDLLHHTCGGWSADGDRYNNYNDPVFSNLSMSNQQLIGWTLDNIPLDTLPGTHFDYSNFGFFLLGRVIEAKTGLPYAQAVNNLVLQPCGITDMAIAGETLNDRLPNEAAYYAKSNDQDPYSFGIHRADACAAWIASSEDMARFLVHVDGLSTVPDILSPNAFSAMTSITPASDGYACGWCVYSNGGGFEHEGGLPGTSSDQAFSTKITSGSNGNYGFSIVINTRSLDNNYGSDLDNIFWNAVQYISVWPSYDLF